jgi:hypothetical protein
MKLNKFEVWWNNYAMLRGNYVNGKYWNCHALCSHAFKCAYRAGYRAGKRAK